MTWLNKNRPLAVLLGGVVLLAGIAAVVFAVIGNSDGDDGVGEALKEKIPSVSTAGSTGGPDNVTRLTPAEASMNLDELPGNFEVDEPNSFAMNLTTFASGYWFKSNDEGTAKAQEWAIINGFQVFYQPVGLFADTLKGTPYLRIETYQFADPAGARKAFAHINNVLKSSTGSDAVEARPLANQSSAYRFIQGTVGTSEMVAVFHRYTFRRGNTVVSVQTWGGESYMNIDPARNIAAAIDDKLLGSRPAVEPTPLPTPSILGVGAE